jgi:primosomal protein N' (replication factor Y)
LTVHNNPEKVSCHICGASWNIPKRCVKCNSDKLKTIWVWTKQIEESLKNNLKDDASIFRFDLDSTKNKTEKKEALEKLESADIIIATKMITTGFDFRNLWLIAVILAEQEFSFPMYDSEEKAYINIKQLIGRWNRLWEKTEIIIQTFIPENEIIKTISEKNYKNFFLDTLKERKLFGYPPFKEMITLEYRDKSEKKALDFMFKLQAKLDLINVEKKIEIILNKKSFKKHNQYYLKIILKWDDLRSFITNIKSEIFRNSNLSVIFE